MDCCMLSQDSGLLQQGCDITGGVYLKVESSEKLLQYLIWMFLPSPAIRRMLGAAPPIKVDYRAACFCHRQLVDIGSVCQYSASSTQFVRRVTACFKCLKLFLPRRRKKSLKSHSYRRKVSFKHILKYLGVYILH